MESLSDLIFNSRRNVTGGDKSQKSLTPPTKGTLHLSFQNVTNALDRRPANPAKRSPWLRRELAALLD